MLFTAYVICCYSEKYKQSCQYYYVSIPLKTMSISDFVLQSFYQAPEQFMIYNYSSY